VAGETPGDYTSKLDVRLEPGMPSVAALKLLFLKLLRTMQTNEVGLCADLDPEFLHDFRVAVRRTRALLGRSKEHLDPKVLEEFNREFRWLGQLTGKKRDLDVFLIKLEQLTARRVVEEVEDLGPLIDLLRQRQHQEGKALATFIRSSRYRDLVSNWSKALEREDSFRAERFRESVYALASPRIWKIYRKILRIGAGLSESTEPRLLHELRIDCKKLRYLLEFFRSLYPQPLMGGLISDLKGLQDILGDFNDCHVQYQNLKTYVDEAWAEKEIPARTFLVAGRLLEQMETSQQALRRHFSDRFNLFANRSRKKALKKELSRRRIRVV
jgi:CHAD domain-containing protein